jgi:hypothetical protein
MGVPLYGPSLYGPGGFHASERAYKPANQASEHDRAMKPPGSSRPEPLCAKK